MIEREKEEKRRGGRGIFNYGYSFFYQLTHLDLDMHIKVARSRISDGRVWRRARDYLGLMNEPAICLSVLGPSRPSCGFTRNPGTVNWSDGGTKMIAHIPFYILGEQEGQECFIVDLYKKSI